MTLPVSPNAISLSMVNIEMGLAAGTLISLNDSAVRTLFARPSGVISMSDGYGKANPVGQVLYTNPGYSDSGQNFSFVVPANVTSISAVCIASTIKRGATVLLSGSPYGSGLTPIGGNVGGGNGGQAGAKGYYVANRGGGGGAGGYSGNGGTGFIWDYASEDTISYPPTAGQGGGGGGGGQNGYGGGVGVLGQGASGAAYGGAGSGGGYGGGSNGYTSGSPPYAQQSIGYGSSLRWKNGIAVTPGETLDISTDAGWSWAVQGDRACRIIWGLNRSFPSTNTGNL